jgi:cell division protein FtsQ
MQLPWKKRNRRQTRAAGPGLLARINWRAAGAAAGFLVAGAALAAVLMYALDRPVRRAVAEVVKGGLASVDLDRVRERIERIDWVDEAVVQRRWPDAIRVVITEQVPAARWNDAGLLNARGELFIRNARYVPPELPLLEGPEGSEGAVAQLYLDVQGRMLEAGLRLTGVRLDDRGAWEIRLANGVVVKLGRQAVNERLERFIRLAGPLVAKRYSEITHVDMRYTNGFSVGWNPRSALAVAPQEDATPDA